MRFGILGVVLIVMLMLAAAPSPASVSYAVIDKPNVSTIADSYGASVLDIRLVSNTDHCPSRECESRYDVYAYKPIPYSEITFKLTGLDKITPIARPVVLNITTVTTTEHTREVTVYSDCTVEGSKNASTYTCVNGTRKEPYYEDSYSPIAQNAILPAYQHITISVRGSPDSYVDNQLTYGGVSVTRWAGWDPSYAYLNDYALSAWNFHVSDSVDSTINGFSMTIGANCTYDSDHYHCGASYMQVQDSATVMNGAWCFVLEYKTISMPFADRYFSKGVDGTQAIQMYGGSSATLKIGSPSDTLETQVPYNGKRQLLIMTGVTGESNTTIYFNGTAVSYEFAQGFDRNEDLYIAALDATHNNGNSIDIYGMQWLTIRCDGGIADALWNDSTVVYAPFPTTDYAPNVTSVTITPAEAYENESLNCSGYITDPDSDTLNVTWYWYKNNAIQSNYTANRTGLGVNTTYWTTRLYSNSTIAGDNITCKMRAFDGNKYAYENASVTMGEYTPPIQTKALSIDLTTTSGVMIAFTLTFLYVGLLGLGYMFRNPGVVMFAFFIGVVLGLIFSAIHIMITLVFLMMNIGIMYGAATMGE